jgi:hypothetical protein
LFLPPPSYPTDQRAHALHQTGMGYMEELQSLGEIYVPLDLVVENGYML